jgi:propanol-preferring alcohol dehydrogenase
MKAMVLRQPMPIARRPLTMVEVPDPKPDAGEVLVRVAVCGVCRTDLHVVEGDLPARRSPLIPGHQVVGKVSALGPRCQRFQVGERIGVAWLHRTCGACEFCGNGAENLCTKGEFTGWTIDGGYAECMTVGEDFAYRLPEGFDDRQAAPLLCAGVIGYRALRLSGVQPGQRLGLYGFGASAHIAIQVARHWGCDVYVFTRSERNRQLARDLGAAWAGDATRGSQARLHAAVIFAPAGELVPVALEALERRGTVALAGIHMSPIPAMDYTKHLYHERAVRSVANATRKDAEELLALAAMIPIRTTTCAYPLERATEALLDLKSGKLTGSAVLTCG